MQEGLQDSAEVAEQRKREELQRSLWDLGLSWGLVLVCCTHHLGHWLHGLGWHGLAHGPLLTALANPIVSLALGSVALLGPGRPLIQDGILSLSRCLPLPCWQLCCLALHSSVARCVHARPRRPRPTCSSLAECCHCVCFSLVSLLFCQMTLSEGRERGLRVRLLVGAGATPT